ncbi:MAG: PAS domain S-box protein, partial [Myxococcales bacterium]|nr:PAS domain S-box protein [Myxococcales bacterium]
MAGEGQAAEGPKGLETKAESKPPEYLILDSLGFGVLVLDVERRVLAVNQHAEHLLEVSESELLGKNLAETWELVLPGGKPLSFGARPSDHVEASGFAIRDQLIGFRAHDKPLRWTLLSLSLIAPEVSKHARFLVHFQLLSDEPQQQNLLARLDALVQQRSRQLRDHETRLHAAQQLTERVQAELKTSEELYQSVVQAMAEGVAIHDATGRIRKANDAAARILGLTHAQLEGLSPLDPRWRLVDGEGRDLPTHAIPAVITAITGESCRRRLLGLIRGDGARAWLEVSSEPLGEPARDGEGVGRYPVVVTFIDVTLEREATRALEESRARFASVLEAVPGIVFRYLRKPTSGRFEFITGTVKPLTGLEPEQIRADGAGFFARVHPADLGVAQEVFATGREMSTVVDVPMRIRGEEDAWRWVRIRAVPEKLSKGTLWTGVMLDITEERKLADQVRSSQRREAIATVVAGVAHNFNNALAAMIPNLEHALESSSGQQRIELDETLRTAQLAGGLVRQLMVVARQQSSAEAVVTDFGNVVRDVARLCKGLFQGRIRIEADVCERRVPIAMDPSQLHQMVLNLCINARDAMRDVDAGRLSISLSEANHGESVGYCLTVADNGCGMDEETQRKLGEPFFTTKAPGQGTGLGLATIYAMVRDLSGTVECTSSPGVGTQFRIWLPKSELRIVGHSNAKVPEQPQGKRVLLVDDEPLVRRALARGLRSRGWLVEEASDGMDALAFIEASQDRFDVAVLDLSMPGL